MELRPDSTGGLTIKEKTMRRMDDPQREGDMPKPGTQPSGDMPRPGAQLGDDMPKPGTQPSGDMPRPGTPED